MTAFRAIAAALTLSASNPALLATAHAQSAPPAASAAATTDDADPLTPKATEAAPPQAPGAPAALAKSANPQHPAVTIALARLAESTSAKGGTKEDRAALAAFYADHGGQPLWTTADGPNGKARAAVAELARAADYGLSGKDAYKVATPASFATAEAQAEHELSMSLALMTYVRHARGGRVDPGSISRMIDMRPRPFEAKSVIASLAAADDPAATLRQFHPQHDGFQRLQKALASARLVNTTPETIQRLEVNLERWRWMPDDLGAFHIANNIPEQITRTFKAGTIVLTERIVVGKPSSPTPTMSADMQFVIFHPSWGVPSGIKANEIGPMLARASRRNQTLFDFGGDGDGAASKALGRHQLKVSLNGRELNPDSVDWNKVDVRQFHFTQPPSSQNVLGVVKFRFPNKHDVYMHDTTEKSLFVHTTRAYSHGCMRVQNPIHLAEVILAHDKGWSAEKVRGLVPGGRTSDIALSKPVPVHLTYFTASVDDGGKLNLHGDIYGMDSRVASALAGKSVTLAAAKVDGGTPKTAKKRDRVAAGAKQPVEKAWNPFSGLFGN
jgi:L,D-transpeptidase YcbB